MLAKCMPRTGAPRIVSICIEGSTSANRRDNEARLQRVADVMIEVNQRWGALDAIVLPGGFLRTASQPDMADPGSDLRPLLSAMQKAARKLTNSEGCHIVFGVDGPRRAGYSKEQWCVAVSAAGLKGAARKIFPTIWEGQNGYECRIRDYADPTRVVYLPSGRTAILCACYDMFGVVTTRCEWSKVSALKQFDVNGDARRLRARALAEFSELLREKKVSVGLAAIHAFPSDAGLGAQSGVVMWQRHGIATCSAALNSGWAVGASHFNIALPASPFVSPLAAREVPRSHISLNDNRERKAHNWRPQDYIHNDNWLIRQFG